MTQKEFISALARTPRDWQLQGERIRREPADAEPQCPITAVAVQLDDAASYSAASVISATVRLEMQAPAVMDLVAASDGLDHADPLVRMQLLEACGLLVEECDGSEEETADLGAVES